MTSLWPHFRWPPEWKGNENLKLSLFHQFWTFPNQFLVTSTSERAKPNFKIKFGVLPHLPPFYGVKRSITFLKYSRNSTLDLRFEMLNVIILNFPKNSNYQGFCSFTPITLFGGKTLFSCFYDWPKRSYPCAFLSNITGNEG